MENKTKQDMLIGVDAQAFTALDSYPPMLFYYCFRHLLALIQGAEATKFVFFSPGALINQIIGQLFPFPNVSCGVAGEESRSSLSLYHIPDQLSLLPSRPPPLLFAPRTIPISLLMHNVLAASAVDVFLKRWPPEVIRFHLHALEMITASPAQLLCPSQLEADLVKGITQVPQKQISNLGGAAALPLSFGLESERWSQIQSRLNLPEIFVVAPSDTLSQEGERELLEYWHALRESNPTIVLVRPALRRFVGALLPDPISTSHEAIGVIYEPELSYEEFLELLGRSSAYLLPGNIRSSAGACEAASFGVSVFYSQANGDEGILLNSKHDLVAAINGQRLIPAKSRNVQESWDLVAQRTMQIWASLM